MLIDENRLRYNTDLGSGTTKIFMGTLGIEQNFDRFAFDASVSRLASRLDERARQGGDVLLNTSLRSHAKTGGQACSPLLR